MTATAAHRAPEEPVSTVTCSPPRLAGLDVLRALAVLLVSYLSLASWLRRHGGTGELIGLIDSWLIRPAHFNQDFGFFGFALFLLLSGFLAIRSGAERGGPALLIRRFCRVVPGFAVVVLLTVASVSAGLFPLPDGTTSVTGALRDMAVVSYFREPFVPLVGLAWTLTSILAGYLLLAAVLPVLRWEPWLAIGLQLTGYVVLLALARQGDGGLAAMTGTVGGFGPVLLLGQIVWTVHAGRIPLWAGGALAAGCWAVFLWADGLRYGRHADSYPLTLAVATLLLITAVLASPSVPHTALVDYLAGRSYSIFLVHQPVGYPVLAATVGVLGRIPAVLLAVALTALVAELLYRGVERPVGRFCSPSPSRFRAAGLHRVDRWARWRG